MAAIITEKFRLHNAEQFLESFSEASSNNYYLFIGKSSSYTSGTTGGDDNSPPVPNDDIVNEFRAWDAMLASKLISSTDVAYVIPRKNWSNNTRYDMYKHNISPSNLASSSASSLWESDFYFMTSQYKVYKVLDNAGGATYSGAEPTSTQTTPFFLGGYYLKYMYTASASYITKFLTNDFIPIEEDTAVTNAAISGAIEVVSVEGGSGYDDGTYYSPIDGDGSGGIVQIVITGGVVQRFGSTNFTEIYAKGTGYTYASVDLNDVYSDTGLTSAASVGAGTGASITPIISPYGGHGSNVYAEMGGHYVMMNAKLLQAEGDDFTVANDFREVGIVVDPYEYGTTTLYTAATARQSFAVKLAAAPLTDFSIDEKITQANTGAVGRIVDWDATNNIIYYLQEYYADYGLNTSGNYVAFTGTDIITGSASGANGTPSTLTGAIALTNGNNINFTNGYSNPELEPYSGKIVYNEKRRPISRAADQTEDIKIIVEFWELKVLINGKYQFKC